MTENTHETNMDAAGLTPEEVGELKQWVRERRELRAQGRLLISLGLAITGFVGWMWGDQIKQALHRALG